MFFKFCAVLISMHLTTSMAQSGFFFENDAELADANPPKLFFYEADESSLDNQDEKELQDDEAADGNSSDEIVDLNDDQEYQNDEAKDAELLDEMAELNDDQEHQNDEAKDIEFFVKVVKMNDFNSLDNPENDQIDQNLNDEYLLDDMVLTKKQMDEMFSHENREIDVMNTELHLSEQSDSVAINDELSSVTL